MTGVQYGTLCNLVYDRITGLTAGRKLDRMAVRRLRRALDEGTGREGFGLSLIRPVGKSKYVLAKTAEAIYIHPSIRNSLLTNCVENAVADALLAAATHSTDH